MRFRLPLLLYFVCIAALEAQIVIDNSLTEKHQQVGGTKFSMIPPSSFQKASNVNGFEHVPTKSLIYLLDFPAPYSDASLTQIKEILLEEGVVTDSIVPAQIGEFSGLLISGTLTLEPYGHEFYNYNLVFGSEKKTFFISGIAPNDNLEYKQLVYQAMNSLVFESEKEIDPFEALDYTIDPNGSQITLGTIRANSLIYTTDGEVPTKSADRTTLYISSVPRHDLPQDKKQYALKILKLWPLGIDNIDSSEAIEIDGLEGVEIYATGENMNYKDYTGAFQIILFKEDTFHQFVGLTNQDQPRTRLKDLKDVVLSFRLK